MAEEDGLGVMEGKSQGRDGEEKRSRGSDD